MRPMAFLGAYVSDIKPETMKFVSDEYIFMEVNQEEEDIDSKGEDEEEKEALENDKDQSDQSNTTT